MILGEGCHALGNGLERAAFGDGERVRHRTGRQLVDDGVERHTARECVGTGLELGINAHLVDALREVSRIGNQTASASCSPTTLAPAPSATVIVAPDPRPEARPIARNSC